MLGFALGEVGVEHGRNLGVDAAILGVEVVSHLNLAGVVPTDEVREAAAFPPHLVLLLVHDILEGELGADLAGAGTLLDLVEGCKSLGLVSGANAGLCIEEESLGVSGYVEVGLVGCTAHYGVDVVSGILLAAGEDPRRLGI